MAETVTPKTDIATTDDYIGFPERVNYVIETTCNGDVIAFSEISDISTSTLRGYLRGDTEPKRTVLIKIAEAGDVSLVWLMTGKGHPEIDQTPSLPVYDPLTAQQIILKQNVKVMSPISPRGISSMKLNKSWFTHLNCTPATIILVLVDDHAMNTSFSKGDVVLVDYSYEDVKEGIFLISYYGDAMFRRLMRMPDGSVSVLLDNPAYPHSIITDFTDPKSPAKVLGRAIYCFTGSEL